jgi:hypothetical protein
MQRSRIEFSTGKSVQECAATFREAVRSSCGGTRRIKRGGVTIPSRGDGEVEFFTPGPAACGSLSDEPAWQSAAWIPGLSKVYEPDRLAVHIYVVDHGAHREVQLVGPHGARDKDSAHRLLLGIADRYPPLPG